MVCNVDDLVAGALQGFAVTVFAFGQTGSVGLKSAAEKYKALRCNMPYRNCSKQFKQANCMFVFQLCCCYFNHLCPKQC